MTAQQKTKMSLNIRKSTTAFQEENERPEIYSGFNLWHLKAQAAPSTVAS